MSLAIVASRALAGIDAPEVTVEAHLANGLPAFTLVGLPDTEVKESRERVRAAFAHLSIALLFATLLGVSRLSSDSEIKAALAG